MNVLSNVNALLDDMIDRVYGKPETAFAVDYNVLSNFG
jgi:hypothetical protein